MTTKKELKFAELVINPCSLSYGSSPCQAEIGVTGDRKCFNSPRTCQDAQNYTEGDEQVIRWSIPTSDLPKDVDSIPCITGITRRPMTISPGESLGVRESVKVTMHNFRHNDVGFDPYYEERPYNAYNQGTFWGKFFSRWGTLEGKEFRLVDGYLGQSIDAMERRYYQVDSISGPDVNGNVSFTAKDIMKFMDNDKAQLPMPSPGVLLNDITENSNFVDFDSNDILDLYGDDGIASIGDEVVSYTKQGNRIRLIERGLRGTTSSAHEAGETFQEARVFTDLKPSEIIRDILQEATQIPAEYIDFDSWDTEVETYLGRTYSAEIMQTESAKDLIEQLVVDAGLTIYTDVVRKKIVLRVLRDQPTLASINDDSVIDGTLGVKSQPSKRVSDVWIYYGKINPLEAQSEKKNYAAIRAELAQDDALALENAPSSIREIYSRWIPVFDGGSASAAAQTFIARYTNAPTGISFKYKGDAMLSLGGLISFESRVFEDDTGAKKSPFKCQITSLDYDKGVYSVMAETADFEEIATIGNEHIITIDQDILNVNLREIHDSLYSSIDSGDTVNLVLASGAKIGSSSNSIPALTVGDWPSSVTLRISGTGRIQGAGGPSEQNGGTALLTAYPIAIEGSNLEIWGGGGGGGGYVSRSLSYTPGGGGAGFLPGSAGATTELGERIDDGPGSGPGRGGDPGEDGARGTDDSDDESASDIDGGFAGSAIDGVSFVTFISAADVLGPQVN